MTTNQNDKVVGGMLQIPAMKVVIKVEDPMISNIIAMVKAMVFCIFSDCHWKVGINLWVNVVDLCWFDMRV